MKYLYCISYSFSADSCAFDGCGQSNRLLDHKIDDMSALTEINDSICNFLLQEYKKNHWASYLWNRTPNFGITYTDFKLLLELKDEEN